MTQEVSVHPLVSPWGRFGLYSFFIDAPEPAIVDTGIASSPADGMVPALGDLGRSIEEVRWILLTHGHIDHVGGAHALWELTGRRARVVIHEADAHLLRSRRAHVDQYVDGRQQYLNDPNGVEQQTKTADEVISGEMEPSVLLKGGETLSLGGNVSVSVHRVPGHTAGSVAYVVDGQRAVFVGDAVQIHGAANRFPGYEDPVAYRSSLQYLRAEIRPQHLYLGIRTAWPTGCLTASSSTASRPSGRSRRAWTSRLASATSLTGICRTVCRRRTRCTPRSPGLPRNSPRGIPPWNRRRSSPRFTAISGSSTLSGDIAAGIKFKDMELRTDG